MKTYIEKFKKAEELDDAIIEVLMPTEVVSEVKNGKKSTKTRKLYPGYVFINMRLYDEHQKLINKPWYFGNTKEFLNTDPHFRLTVCRILNFISFPISEQTLNWRQPID